jgi:hypothetical protein
MKIEPDEEQIARQWLTRRGETPAGAGLHAWVSALDAGTRRALGQYLRLRRHRLRAPKVALEITAPIHKSLSDYAVQAGNLSLGEAIGLLLVAARPSGGRIEAPDEVGTLREVLAARDKEIAALRDQAAGTRRTSPASGARQRQKGSSPLEVAPPCPLCGGAMRLELSGQSRYWVCTTATPRSCVGTLHLAGEVALSPELIRADLAQRWRTSKGSDAGKFASVVKRTVTALEHTVEHYARYWSAEETARFQAAAAALGKVGRAAEQVGRWRQAEERAQTARLAQRTPQAQRLLQARMQPQSRRERIILGFALSFDVNGNNQLAADLRRRMSDIDRDGLRWGAQSSADEIDVQLRDFLTEEIQHLAWRFASDQRPVAELVAEWETAFAERLEGKRAAAEALANEVDVWLVQRAIVEANTKGRGAT